MTNSEAEFNRYEKAAAPGQSQAGEIGAPHHQPEESNQKAYNYYITIKRANGKEYSFSGADNYDGMVESIRARTEFSELDQEALKIIHFLF
ncbi:MAG TPA: hypothetical protein VH186_18920 [Chloroflexia bacterium]|nr:hypothetical protein [Chloroflexia bacterium]